MDVSQRRTWIADELVRSFEERRLTLAYQPIVRLSDGYITSVEMLLRWECPGIGPLNPGVFIALAEERGLAGKLGEWAMRDACAQIRLWQTMGIARLRLHLNASPYELRNLDYASLLASVCIASGIARQDVTVEIAQLATLLDDPGIVEMLMGIRSIGAPVVADDVCGELRDVEWIARAPIDAIKLNRSCISSLPSNEEARGLVRNVVNIAHEHGLRVLALGVETPAELSTIMELGCDEVQGFYFCSPMEVNRFTTLLYESGCKFPVPAVA